MNKKLSRIIANIIVFAITAAFLLIVGLICSLAVKGILMVLGGLQ